MEKHIYYIKDPDGVTRQRVGAATRYLALKWAAQYAAALTISTGKLHTVEKVRNPRTIK